MNPKRVQMSRQHPWRADNPDAVIVDRRTVYGNRFEVFNGHRQGWLIYDHERRGEGYVSAHPSKEAATAAAIRLYRKELRRNRDLVARIRRELAGRDLCCWCALDAQCHADVLLELANRGAS